MVELNAAGGYGTTQYGPAKPASSLSAYDYGSMGMAAVGGITSAYAQYQAGKAQKKIANWNAAQARVQSAQALQAGEFNANRVAIQAEQTQGRQRAAEAGSGIIAGAGTSRAVEASSEAASDMDRFMIELNAKRQAYGYQVKAAGDTLTGQMDMQRGEMGAASTLLNTGSQVWLDADAAYGGHRGNIQFG